MNGADMTTPRFFTLSQVTARIAEIFAPHLGKTFWVRGEISSGRERGGSFYCDLVETGEGGSVTAKLSCTVWGRDLEQIRRKFEEAGLTLRLDNGTEVGLLCSLQYDPRYGISLKVRDADPAFALGELELRRRAILLRLEQEELFEPNRRLPVPALPQRIGVVTSRGSAAFSDFLKTLSDPAFGFRILLADALVQGAQAEASVLRALDALERLQPDLVVLIRGGGSRTELAALDSEAIARRIAALRVPVWTGIGHETDESVLDFVANRRHKTPTAVAEAIRDRYVETARHLETAARRLGTTWSYRRQMERRRLDRDTTGIRQGTRKLIDVARAGLEQRRQSLALRVQQRLAGERSDHAASRRQFVSASRALLRAEEERLQTARGRCRTAWSFRGEMERRRLDRDRVGVRQGSRKILDVERAELGGRRLRLAAAVRQRLARAAAERERLASQGMTLRMADPAQSLKRGFALVYDRSGRMVTSVRGLARGETLKTRVSDGTIASTVAHVEEDDGGR
jgi:exodeoxyribonuclease VII large subunit